MENTEKQQLPYEQAIAYARKVADAEMVNADRFLLMQAYLAGYMAKPSTMVNDLTPPITVEAKSNGKPLGIRVTAMGESFVVALKDVSDSDRDKYRWSEACTVNAPTRKQASIMAALWDELNEALDKANGQRMDDGEWRWTSTERNGATAWFIDCEGGRIHYYSKSGGAKVRPILKIE